MPSLVGVRDTNGKDYNRGGRVNGIASNGVFDQYRDDFARDDMRQDEDDRYRRAVRNGGPSFDRFNTDYLDQSSLSDFRSSEPKFELDHLATFSAGARNGVIHAEDGLRKLRQMENTTGIWSMRCILIVERNHLVIVDNSTGEELEKFPIQLVQDPTAIFKNDHREIYNNLILFTIIDDPKKRSPQADMHIFQSSRAPAQEIVDEILAAKSGQQRLPQGGEPRIFPPTGALATDSSSKAYNFQGMREFIDSRQYQTNNTATEMHQFNQASYNQAAYNQHTQFSGPMVQRQSLITRVTPLRERESIEGGSTEVLEKDVQLLNHCFDDIEKFVARLQQAAESYKELEKRKRDRGAKNKKKQSGDGMLNARARPPPDRDFVDIFQKFKLSFNLLAKLKAHIHDPNAPELVHFLFTPLSLIYEASRDPYHGNQNLGDQAVAPVITGDAKQLLLNCLTSKEIELWQALGKHWTVSRDEWQGPIPPYVPEFYDGWQPAAGLDDLPIRSAIMAQPTIIAAPLPMIEPARTPSIIDVRDRGHQVMPQRPIPFPDDDGPPVDIFHRQDDFNRVYRPNSREFDSRGFEALNIPSTSRDFEPSAGRNYESSRYEAQTHERSPPRLSMDSPSYSEFSQPYNRLARQDVPKNIERDHLPPGGMSRQDDNASYLDELKRMDDSIIYEAAHDRVGKNAKELTVQRGDILQVLDNSKNWWKLRNYKGEIGFAPYTILKAIKAEGEHNFNQPQQLPGRYPPAVPAYFGEERGHAQRDTSPGRNTEHAQQSQEQASHLVNSPEEPSAVASQQSESKTSGSPQNTGHELLNIETSQLQIRPVSDTPEKRTPSPIQQLDSILLSNSLLPTPAMPSASITQDSPIVAAQRQTSITLQPPGSILHLNRRFSPVQNKGVSIMTRTQMITSPNKEPERRRSSTRQRRDSPSPKRWLSRMPSKSQSSPTIQKRDSPTPDRRISVTTQTQTSPLSQRRESNRHHSPVLRRRGSNSPKRWGSRIPPKRQDPPKPKKLVSPASDRRISVTTQTQTSPTLRRLESGRHHSPPYRRDSERIHSPRPHKRVSPTPKRWGSKVTSTVQTAPTPYEGTSPNTGRTTSSLLQKRRSSSPIYDNDPEEYQQRGPANLSYVNIPVINQSTNRSKTAVNNTPAERRNQPSFRRDPNPTSLPKSAPERVPLAPPLPPRPNKNRLYEKQSPGHRNKTTENNIKNSLHEELLNRLRRPRSFKSQKEQRVQQTKEVLFIDKYSTAEEVSEWMKNKGFSDLAQETYEDCTGSDMFQLSLAEMEEDLGHEEAIRLDGQLTLQKSSSGYETRSAQELNEILRRRKQDCEPDDM